MTQAVHTTNLTFAYNQRPVVNDISLSIDEGSIYGFVGPNGAGKSTTIKLLLGLLTPQSGSVQIFGMDMKNRRATLLRSIGSLVETPSLYPHLTGEENLEVVRKIHRVPKNTIAKVLSDVGLASAKEKKVKEYSLGMKQRLGIALSLLHSPRLLILDEPINGLDPEGILEFRSFLRILVRENGVTVLLSSHILSELEQVVTDVGIIADGTMKFQGSLAALQQMQQRNLLLRVSERDRAVKIIRRRIAAEISGAGDTLSLAVPDKETAASINRALIEEGIDVYEMMFEQPSLESVFLKFIQSEGRK
ncbi:MAG: ABC transporter ATP-binding protein [Bacteroidota bacterium]